MPPRPLLPTLAPLLLLPLLLLSPAGAAGQAADTAPSTQPGPPAQDVTTALRLSPFGVDELPSGFAAPELRTWSVPDDFRAHGALSAIRVDLAGPDQTDAFIYLVYPGPAEARARFDNAAPPRSATFGGEVAPPDLAYPARCLNHHSAFGQARRGKTDCFVLVGNVEVWATTAVVGDVQGGNLDNAVALAKAGVAHLERLQSDPPIAPLGQLRPDGGNAHANPGAPLQFDTTPPSSGTHYPTWLRTGVYPDAQDPGLWLHSLEHGYVVLLYNCPTDCPELRQQLQAFYDAAPKSAHFGYQKLVVTAYANLQAPLAIVAWGRVDELDAFDADRLNAFYAAYHDSGPEDAG